MSLLSKINVSTFGSPIEKLADQKTDQLRRIAIQKGLKTHDSQNEYIRAEVQKELSSIEDDLYDTDDPRRLEDLQREVDVLEFIIDHLEKPKETLVKKKDYLPDYLSIVRTGKKVAGKAYDLYLFIEKHRRDNIINIPYKREQMFMKEFSLSELGKIEDQYEKLSDKDPLKKELGELIDLFDVSIQTIEKNIEDYKEKVTKEYEKTGMKVVNELETKEPGSSNNISNFMLNGLITQKAKSLILSINEAIAKESTKGENEDLQALLDAAELLEHVVQFAEEIRSDFVSKGSNQESERENRLETDIEILLRRLVLEYKQNDLDIFLEDPKSEYNLILQAYRAPENSKEYQPPYKIKQRIKAELDSIDERVRSTESMRDFALREQTEQYRKQQKENSVPITDRTDLHLPRDFSNVPGYTQSTPSSSSSAIDTVKSRLNKVSSDPPQKSAQERYVEPIVPKKPQGPIPGGRRMSMMLNAGGTSYIPPSANAKATFNPSLVKRKAVTKKQAEERVKNLSKSKRQPAMAPLPRMVSKRNGPPRMTPPPPRMTIQELRSAAGRNSPPKHELHALDLSKWTKPPKGPPKS